MRKISRIQEYSVLIYRLLLVYLFYFIARILFYIYNKDVLKVDYFSDFLNLAYSKIDKAKKKNIDSINSANRVVACLVQYVNTVEQKAFQSIKEMKEHMAEKAKTNQTTNATDSSDDEYKSESDDNSDD